MAIFGEIWVYILNFLYGPEKAYRVVLNRVLCRILRQNPCGHIGCIGERQNLPPSKIAEFRMRGKETPDPSWIKFCRVYRYPRRNHLCNFGDDRLMDFRTAGIKLYHSPLASVAVFNPFNTVKRAFYKKQNWLQFPSVVQSTTLKHSKYQNFIHKFNAQNLASYFCQAAACLRAFT